MNNSIFCHHEGSRHIERAHHSMSMEQNGYMPDIIQYIDTAPTIMLMSDFPLNLLQVMVGSVSSEMIVYRCDKKHVMYVVRMHDC